MSDELDKILAKPGTSMLQALFAIDKERREAVERAEAAEAVAAHYKQANAALRAHWARVPWDKLRQCAYWVREYGYTFQESEIAEAVAAAALAGLNAYAPQEAAE